MAYSSGYGSVNRSLRKEGEKKGGTEMAEKINQSTTVADTPKLGDFAPDFAAPATNGKNIKLSDLKGS